VLRNRAKRRMRALMRALVPLHGQAGWDYVLVAKPQATVTRDFADMLADLSRAFAQVHRAAAPTHSAAPEGTAP
jgi:ribonuclease P protein component